MLKLFCVVLCLTIAAHAIEVDDNSDTENFELPPGTISCQIDSPDRNECIKEAIQDMLPKLKNGLKSLNIPPLDPFVLEQTTVSYKRGSILYATGNVRNVKIHGASNAVIQDVKTNITRKHIHTAIKTYLPHVFIEGLYRGEGRFNNLKIKSKGYFNITATDVTIISKTKGVIETTDGVEHIRMTNYDIVPTIGDMKFFATGILPDPELNRISLEFINQYWPYMYREMLPESKEIWEPIMLREANKFLLHVPLRKMLYYGEEA